ncbi:uncharacterized mitochondrial protein AtMg00810-like [Telopea speciosissima]|uniref:uncharacterized mitochondrial protein AtMg00810-like n=1 Tax=Telopea speciosissima TaxID=54955 RepID=UPI001CC72DA3|nr:uncharacterized mitochondrial protein AtMg00810-like [Telopea speciosissima]
MDSLKALLTTPCGIRHTKDHMIILLLYVDDIILTGPNEHHLASFISQLGQEFAMTDLGSLHHFLGIEATWSTTGLTLSQTKYAVDLLNQTGMIGSKLCTTPVWLGSKLSTVQGEPLPDPKEYRTIVGVLQYLTMTRPDICYAMNQVCQHMHAPTTAYLVAVKRILRYIKHTVGTGLHIQPSPLSQLIGYSDADWAGCPDTRRSTTGFCTYLGPNLISWGSKKQPTISRSSSEAEYKALAVTMSKLLWLSYLLADLDVHLPLPFILRYDNIPSTHLAANPVLHARTKHIEVDYHFVRDLVVNKKVHIKFVPF